MTKRVVSMLLFTVVVALAGCEKPTEGACKKAVVNIRTLMGTSKMSLDTASDAAWVRSCRGSSKKASVNCAIAAKNLDQLKACGLLKGEELDELMRIDQELRKLRPTTTVPPGPVPGTGSAAVPGTGSAAVPATGSAAVPATGSGSAAVPGTGSGSATGTGSATVPATGSGSAAVPAPAAGSAAVPATGAAAKPAAGAAAPAPATP